MDQHDQNLSQTLSARLDMLQAGQSRMETAVARLADAMVQIARIEVTMNFNSEAIARAFKAIEKLSEMVETSQVATEKRIQFLESSAPVNSLASKWVFSAISSMIGALGGALVVLLLK